MSEKWFCPRDYYIALDMCSGVISFVLNLPGGSGFLTLSRPAIA